MNASSSQRLGAALLLLLLLSCVYTALASVFAWVTVDGQATVINLTAAHYIGFAAIASCGIAYWRKPTYFIPVLGLTLLLGVFNLAVFLPATLAIGLSFGEAQLGLNPFGLLLLAAYYFSNRQLVNQFVRQHLLPASSSKQADNEYRDSIAQFKQAFKRKSIEELRQLAVEDKLVPAAIAAARELLKERL